MTEDEQRRLFLELNSVLVKFWKENGRPDKEVKIKLLEQMLHWYKNMGYCTLDKQEQSPLPEDLEKAIDGYLDNDIDYYERMGVINIIKDAVKFGAEWQAGQGISVNGYILGSRNYALGIENSEKLSYFDDGSRQVPVIVQIRKK